MSLGRLVDVHCDGCGTHTNPFNNAKSARAHARMLGWRSVPRRRLETSAGVLVTARIDLCPRCYASLFVTNEVASHVE